MLTMFKMKNMLLLLFLFIIPIGFAPAYDAPPPEIICIESNGARTDGNFSGLCDDNDELIELEISTDDETTNSNTELTTNTIVNHLNKLMDLGLIEIGMWRVNEENLRAIKSVKVNDTRLTFASIENPVFNKKIDNTNNTNNSDNTNNTNNTQTATPYSDVSNISNVSKNIYNNNSEEEIEVIEVNRND